MSLPENTIIQLSNTTGDIAHQGVLSSNISGSTILTASSSIFPTTSTANSLGHYHYTEPITNALQFLNASGNGVGGHKFYNSNATDSPILYLTIDKDKLLTDTQYIVDKSIQGGAVLLNLPPIIVGTPSQVVFNYPPGLDAFGIQYGVYDNPVQVLFNAGVFVTGTTYYAQATNAQTLVIRATPNPSDPPLDCSVFTNGQIPFAYVSSVAPSSTQISTLSDSLTIVNETDTSILSSTDLTFNSLSLLSTISNIKVKQIDTINQYISAAIYADGRPPTAPTTTIAQQYAYTPSWYFKNTVAGYKINWYVGSLGLTVSDILGLYLSFFNGSNTSNDNAPFITIYTAPTGTNDFAPNFFHSSMTYVFTGSITANTRYTEFVDLGASDPNHYLSTLVNMIPSTVNNPRGEYLPTETIAFFAIGSNSGATVNTVEFAVSKFGIMTATGTTEINYFQN